MNPDIEMTYYSLLFTIKTLERRHCRHSFVFIVNFEHTPHFFLVPLLLTLNKYILAG